MHNHGDDMNNEIGFLPDNIPDFSFTDFFLVGEGLAKFGGFTLWTKKFKHKRNERDLKNANH